MSTTQRTWTPVVLSLVLAAATGAQGQSSDESRSPAAPQPLLYLPLEEKQLVAVPSQGVEVTLKGKPVFSDGKRGQALVVDSEGVSVSAMEVKGKNLADPKQGTIAFWMRPLLECSDGQRHYFLVIRSSANPKFFHHVCIEKDEAFAFQTCKGGAYQDSHFNFKWWNKPTWNTNVWYHLAVTWGPDLKTVFYVNGEPLSGTASSATHSFPAADAPLDTVIVGADSAGTHQANALLDEVVIYGDILTTAQIKALAASGLALPAK